MSGHRGKLILQAVMTVRLLAWIASRLTWESLTRTLVAAAPAWFLLASGLYLLSLAVAAVRWRSIMYSRERPIPLHELLALNLVGSFFNQVLPGSLSGDTARAFYSGRHSGSLTLAAAAVLGDRLLGLGALVALVLADAALERFGGDPDAILTEGVRLNVDGGWVLMLPDPDNPVFYVYGETGDVSGPQKVMDDYVELVRSLIEEESES